MTSQTPTVGRTTSRIHPAWWVAAAAFLTSVGAAGFRSVPGVLMHPLHLEFGWSMALISSAVSINLVLYGLAAPFSAALMERVGIRRVAVAALALIALGSLLPIWATRPWHLLLSWGVLVGLGTGALSMSFVATVVGRWFIVRPGLVSGILTAAAAAGPWVFLPLLASLSEAGGATEADHPQSRRGRAGDAPRRLADRRLLVAGRQFAICGASTNGLVGTHFIPAAHDHGMAETAAAGLLALVGLFDVIGTIFSGWLTDRFDPRRLLGVYYLGRGASLFVLPSLFADSVQPNMFVFILFYGLDWVATVPPTIALCRQVFGDRGPIVFGWVFASHQLGAAIEAGLAGLVRDKLGHYDLAWYVAGGLCIGAAAMCLAVRRTAAAPAAGRSPDDAADQRSDVASDVRSGGPADDGSAPAVAQPPQPEQR